jgi:uncharacterized protein YndB with AHSA1/START domain
MIGGDTSQHDSDFPFSIEAVWRALTDRDELATWLMPNDLVPVVGHKFTMECEPDGIIECQVLDLDPPRRMSWSWTGRFGRTIVSFELSPSEVGTRLHVDHRGWDDSSRDDAQRFDAGWPGKLHALRVLLVAGEGDVVDGATPDG